MKGNKNFTILIYIKEHFWDAQFFLFFFFPQMITDNYLLLMAGTSKIILYFKKKNKDDTDIYGSLAYIEWLYPGPLFIGYTFIFGQ